MKLILLVNIFILANQICICQSVIEDLRNQSIISKGGELNKEFISNVCEYIGNKEVVAMGEASHGASEFFVIKNEFFKKMAKDLGFKSFVIESTFANSYYLNKYCLTGEGNGNESLQMLDNFYWNTQELLDLINWIREFNKVKDERDKIWFIGMDINSRKQSVKIIESYIKKVESILNRDSSEQLSTNFLFSTKRTDKEIEEYLEQYKLNESKYKEHSSAWEYEFFQQGLVNLLKYTRGNRDLLMSKNVIWLKDLRGGKVFIWAHNNHVSKGFGYLGYYLKERYKSDYYSIGFDFLKGKFWAKKGGNALSVLLNGNENKKCEANAPKESYFTYKLSQLNESLLFIDIEIASESSKQLRKIFSKTQRVHNTSEWFSKKNEYQKTILNYSYDGLLYIEEISPSKHFYLEKKYEH